MSSPEYRAWDKEEKTMRPVTMLYIKRKAVYCPLFEFSDFGIGQEFNYAEIELMQYTGYTDSELNKIFEDDVIEHRFMINAGHNDVQEQTEIIHIKDIRHLPFDASSISTKVIGNIYDNPELLRQVSQP